MRSLSELVLAEIASGRVQSQFDSEKGVWIHFELDAGDNTHEFHFYTSGSPEVAGKRQKRKMDYFAC